MRWILLTLLIVTTTATAKPSHFVYNITTDKPISGQRIPELRPIASLTKLMTAIVVLKNNPKFTQEIPYKGHVLVGKTQTVERLLESLLVRSDNMAAEALAENWDGGRKKFIEEMNKEAKHLKLSSTRFADPSGLNKNNVSTAGELVVLLIEANKYNVIKKFSTTKQIQFEKQIGKKLRVLSIPNTNKKLLFDFDNIVISKTGFTNPAGRCLAMVVEKNNELYAVVILGEPTFESRELTARTLIYNILIHEYDYNDKNPQMGY